MLSNRRATHLYGASGFVPKCDHAGVMSAEDCVFCNPPRHEWPENDPEDPEYNRAKDMLRQEFINRAELIVRGMQDRDSGWYDSPDDVVAVIASMLNACYQMGRNSK